MLNANKQIVVIPGFIYRSLVRNKFNIVEFGDYAKLRKILTVEDIACLVAANEQLMIDNTLIGLCSVRVLFNSMTSEQDSEFSRSVLLLANTENIASNIKNNLTASDTNSVEFLRDEDAYKFIMTEDITFVILNEGFLTKVLDFEFKFKFVKEYVSKLYSMYSIPAASSFSMFGTYIKLLNKTVQQ